MEYANISSGRAALAHESATVLEAVPQPTMVVSAEATVLFANRPARGQFGSDIVGRCLLDLHAGDAGSLARFIERCRGTTTPLVGALNAGSGEELNTVQLRGSRLVLESGPAVLLQAHRNDKEQFSALTRQIAELNSQILERQHAEAVLAEALAERELLLRELQHRVKNNMHMLQGLLGTAEREAETGEARNALREVGSRISAINTVQQLLYDAPDLASIGSVPMVKAVAGSALALADRTIDPVLSVAPFEIPIQTAAPLALVINELLTNAVKYGRPQEGNPRIEVRMGIANGWVELTVQDNGPGFVLSQEGKRSSGTGLVRGLVRQLGGSFEVEGTEGAKCVVRYRLPQADGNLVN